MSLFLLDTFGNETEMSRETTILYTLPERGVRYDAAAVLDRLVEARSPRSRVLDEDGAITRPCPPCLDCSTAGANYGRRQNGMARRPSSGQRSGCRMSSRPMAMVAWAADGWSR